VLRRLIPREEGFFDYFEKHAATTVEACRELVALMSDGADVQGLARRIKELETDADTITHECLETLHRTFITPLDRDEIHRLMARLDDVMDFAEAASDQCALYRIERFTPEARGLAETLLGAVEQIQHAVAGLRHMKNARAIKERCVEIHRLENEGDRLLRKAVAGLFDDPRDPVSIIKWKDVYENLESATDGCETVANILEGIVLEHG
jgi:uncharacterized protein Yka (UPF0111/DUF47 family)